MKPTETTPKDAAHHRRIAWAVAQRVGLFLVLGLSLFVIWWSVNRLIEAQRQTASFDQQLARLTSEIERMRATWTEARIAEVDQRFTQARQNLFEGAESVAAWQDEVLEDSVPLALDTTVQFRETRPETIGDQALTVMSAEIELAPAAGVVAERTSYRRVLDLAGRIASNPRRLDLVELAVQGGSNSVRHASALVELWAGETEPRQQ